MLRRPPFGNRVKTAHDMGREYRILSRLRAVYPPAPRPVLYCEDESILGAAFYLMERRRGVILRGSSTADRPLTPDLIRQLCETLVDRMAELHALDYRAAGLDEVGKPQGYVERQVTGWIKRYQDARTDEVPDVERTARWLAENRPLESAKASLIHNDFKFDNLVLDPADLTRIVALLDWEMATIGDPLMDLGTTLAYWTEAADPEPLHFHIVGPTKEPGSLTRREIVERYAQVTGTRRRQHALLLRLRPVQGRCDRAANLRPLCQGNDQGSPLRRVQPPGRRAGPGCRPRDRHPAHLTVSQPRSHR